MAICGSPIRLGMTSTRSRPAASCYKRCPFRRSRMRMLILISCFRHPAASCMERQANQIPRFMTPVRFFRSTRACPRPGKGSVRSRSLRSLRRSEPDLRYTRSLAQTARNSPADELVPISPMALIARDSVLQGLTRASGQQTMATCRGRDSNL
jgi:hypothetical protein